MKNEENCGAELERKSTAKGAVESVKTVDGAKESAGDTVKNAVAATKRSAGKSKASVESQLKPLRKAAKQIADMLCEFSQDRELFFSDGASERRLDTRTLKEFSAVLKEISAVMSELNGEKGADHGGVRIEFSGDALDMGF